MSRVIVIGSGFAGLSAATSLADKGYAVTVLEKNNTPGGRARQFSEQGFTFDMGPSWYWMPDVFEAYFNKFGYTSADFYELIRLDPSYQVVWNGNETTQLPADYGDLRMLFDSIEEGSANRLDTFLTEAAYKYEVGIKDLVYKPGRSITEFLDVRFLMGLTKLDVFKSMHKHIRSFVKNPKLTQLLEFPILFLGATPQNTPALYSLMNFADMKLGTWYPQGGMYKIVEAMLQIAKEKGVDIICNAEVESFSYRGDKIESVSTSSGDFLADVVVAGADYHHIDQEVLEPKYRSYSPKYWEKRVMAPSSLIYYLGISRKLPGLLHHNLFFDASFDQHASEIYTKPEYPSDPLFYACVPSKTDESVAPVGMENLFILIPIASGLSDTEEIRVKYLNIALDRLEKVTGSPIQDSIVYKRTYCINDFKADYHAFRGNAYGLANTLMQTAMLKPSLSSRKLSNLYYTGQLTVPGPGVPPAIISGQVVAGEILKEHKIKNYATV